MKKIIAPGILSLLMLMSIFSNAQAAQQKFPSVIIGNQEWMTINWNYPTPKSFFYNNDSTLDKKYGRLYYYSNAMGAVPPGWHLPTLDEWWELINYLGGPNQASAKMFANNDIGLNLIAGGYKSANISGDNSDLYGFIDKYAFYWTATGDEEQTAYAIHFTPGIGDIEITTYRKANGFSVRYVKDR